MLVRYDLSSVDTKAWPERPASIARYRELLPVEDAGALQVPITPLSRMKHLDEHWGPPAPPTYLKDDGILPTGTFKARGAAVGVARAAELGVTKAVMASAGNAGAAWALYAAAAGLDLTVVMAESAPVSHRTEVEIAGASLELVPGTLADAGARAKEIANESGAFLAATFAEPYRVEGKKTAWLEVFEALGAFPRTIVLPVGGGVAAVAAAKAAEELSAVGAMEGDPPRLVGVQPADCAPIARAFHDGKDDVEPWPSEPRTMASGLRVPAPSEGALVLKVVRASGGTMVTVTEEEMRSALRLLARTEGVLACPEGAATLAAAKQLAATGELEGPVVLYNTGAGIKYLDVI